jgi:hypothetical protein
MFETQNDFKGNKGFVIHYQYDYNFSTKIHNFLVFTKQFSNNFLLFKKLSLSLPLVRGEIRTN